MVTAIGTVTAKYVKRPLKVFTMDSLFVEQEANSWVWQELFFTLDADSQSKIDERFSWIPLHTMACCEEV